MPLLDINTEHKKVYIEPFLGGGSVIIKMLETDKRFDAYICSDLNDKLIITYNQIKYNVHELISLIDNIQSDYNQLDDDEKKKAFYYKLREEFIHETVEPKIAALFIVINKLCFRGLYRVNKSNLFDCPYGYNNYKQFTNNKLLLNIHELFNRYNVHFFHASYQDWYQNFKNVCDDYLNTTYEVAMYLDPPYYNTFDKYTSMGFDNKEFIEFLKKTKQETLVGCHINKLVVSNASGFENLIDRDLFQYMLNVSVIENINPSKSSGTRNEIILY